MSVIKLASSAIASSFLPVVLLQLPGLISASDNFASEPRNQQVGTWQIYTHCCCKQQSETKIKARSKEQSYHTSENMYNQLHRNQ